MRYTNLTIVVFLYCDPRGFAGPGICGEISIKILCLSTKIEMCAFFLIFIFSALYNDKDLRSRF